MRARYEDDRWSPDPTAHKPGDPYPSVLGERQIPVEALEYNRAIWREMGYDGP